MTITGGTALGKDEIDRMVKEAEEFAAEDHKRREAPRPATRPISSPTRSTSRWASTATRSRGRSGRADHSNEALKEALKDRGGRRGDAERGQRGRDGGLPAASARPCTSSPGAEAAAGAPGPSRTAIPGDASSATTRSSRARSSTREARRSGRMTDDARRAGEQGHRQAPVRAADRGGGVRPMQAGRLHRRRAVVGRSRRQTGHPTTARTRPGRVREHLQRLQAEFDNYRKRVLQEQTYAVEMAAEPVMRRLLEVLDDFELALMHASENAGLRTDSCKGVELVYAKLLDALQAEGLERIAGRGQAVRPRAARGADADRRGRRASRTWPTSSARVHAARPGHPSRRRARRAGRECAMAATRSSGGSGSTRTTTRSSACPRTRARPRSRRPTASSRSSTIPTRTPGNKDAEERFKEISARLRRAGRRGEAHELRPGARDGRVGYGLRRVPGRSGGPGGGSAVPGGVRFEDRGGRPRRPARRHVRRRRGRGRQRQQRRSAAPISRPTSKLSFEDAMAGTTVPVTLTGPAPCHDLPRLAARAPGTQPVTCPHVRRRPARSRVNQGFFSMAQTVPACAAARAGSSRPRARPAPAPACSDAPGRSR